MSKSNKKPITMSFTRSYKHGEDGEREIRAIAKEFGLTPENVRKTIRHMMLYDEYKRGS